MKKIIFAGAAPDTGNLGVSALLESMLKGVSSRNKAEYLILDHSKGIRKQKIHINGKELEVIYCGAKHGKRIYLPENFSNIRLSSKLSGWGNPIAKKLLSANIMLDISGGDSFTDLYGSKRFRAITLPKLIAIENKIPLILMPQTYGPYADSKAKEIASFIVKSSYMAFARDEESFQVLKELLGEKFDEEKHIQGVDVAFLLDVRKPAVLPINKINDWFKERSRPTIGINISGLIYNQIENSYSQYGLKANYKKVILLFIKKILEKTNANIVLIPHVLVEESNYESDLKASKEVVNSFTEDERKRIGLIENNYVASEVKWVISQTDWFCGTRMHSTIAGLSMGVPTSAIAYSIKTRRVFKTCGQEKQVIDPRELNTEDVVDGLWNCWIQKEKVKQQLANVLPEVMASANAQMDLICQKISTT